MNNSLIYFFNTHGVFFFLLAAFAYALYREKSKEHALHILVSCVLAGLIALFLKEITDLPRPYITDGSLALAGYSVRTSSLPSLHATLAFAAATTITLHRVKTGIIFLTVAGLIGFGRVVANVHYPIDIGLGAILGTTCSFLVNHIHIDA